MINFQKSSDWAENLVLLQKPLNDMIKTYKYFSTVYSNCIF